MAESLETYDTTMETLHRTGVALTAERSSSRLIQLIVESTHVVTTAELVVLHLVDNSGGLRPYCVSSETVELGELFSAFNRGRDLPVSDGPSWENAPGADLAASTGQTVNVEDVSCSEEFDAAPYRRIEQHLSFRIRSVLCAPMKNHENEIIGVLELVNATDKTTGTVGPFSQDETQIAESLASQAAVALTKIRLVDDYQHMFEALTEVIATAIDEKSKYTGDHCRRVPILTMMVANPAEPDPRGPLSPPPEPRMSGQGPSPRCSPVATSRLRCSRAD